MMITISFTHIMTVGNAKPRGLTLSFKVLLKLAAEASGLTENAIKHRINASDKASDASDETVASIFDNKFCILNQNP